MAARWSCRMAYTSICLVGVSSSFWIVFWGVGGEREYDIQPEGRGTTFSTTTSISTAKVPGVFDVDIAVEVEITSLSGAPKSFYIQTGIRVEGFNHTSIDLLPYSQVILYTYCAKQLLLTINRRRPRRYHALIDIISFSFQEFCFHLFPQFRIFKQIDHGHR